MTKPSVPARPRWPLGAALLTTAGLIGLALIQGLRLNDGHFVYAQDDPYIHLAIARTLATTGVWGISPEGFAAASSSPLWTVMLAVTWPLGGASGLWPLVLNAAAAVWLVFALDRELRPHVSHEGFRLGALLTAALVLPLPTLVLIGMEHTLHVAAVIVFAGVAARHLEAARETSTQASRPSGAGTWTTAPALPMLAALVAALRYEGLFVVAVVAGLSAWRRRWGTAVAIVAAAALPVLAYAAYAMSQGGLPLPNSVLMKSGAHRFGSFGALVSVLTDWVGLLSLYQRPVQAVLIVATLLVVAVRCRAGASAPAAPRIEPWDTALLLAAIFLGTAILHVCLVKLEWFYRYEAYVVGLGLLAVAANIGRMGRQVLPSRSSVWPRPLHRAAIIGLMAALALPLVRRAGEASVVIARASHEVYLQQYQMGLFFRDHYGRSAVALNDIGAVAWLAPARIVDLVGLASSEIADARRRDRIDGAYVEELTSRAGVRVIAAYEWFLLGYGDLPTAWRRVGAWNTIPNVAVSGDRVTFYAPDDAAAAQLRHALRTFAPRLPSGTRQRLFEEP